MPSRSKPKVVSTFSGCGGSSLGYTMAGFKVALACEWDDHAVKTYKANFKRTPVFHGDVCELSVDQALELTKLEPCELDVFDGSPPCQGFSTAKGKRDAGDGRNQLFRQYVRLLEGLKPRAFVMENVKGMVIGSMKPIFFEILAALRETGYNVKARVINAKWFGVPQSRERTIFIGVRGDIDVEPSHPVQTVDEPLTSSEALVGCPEDDDYPRNLDAYGRLWSRVQYGKSAASVLPGGNNGFNNCIKLNPNRPSPTIIASNTGKGYSTLMHFAEARPCTIRELARLASFPDDFVFPSDKKTVSQRYKERASRIGNCVPPLMMKAIAAHVRDTVLK